MATRLNHVAIVSENYAMVTQFYQAVFGFRAPTRQTNFNAATVGDGYVGINVNPRRPARPAGLDHFGVQVDDVNEVLDTLTRKYPEIHALKRPSNRPFAGITTHDPDGNVFDFSQSEMANRSEIYKETESGNGWSQDRVVTHIGVRTLHPEQAAEFYIEALGLAPANKAPDDPNFYVTDGRVTLTLMRWDILDFAGTGIVRPGPNHIGIRVDNIAAFREELVEKAGMNPTLAPNEIAMGPEGEATRAMFERSVPYAQYQMSDNGNVLIAIHE